MHDKDNKGVIKYEEFLSGKKYIHKTYLASAFEKKEKKKKGNQVHLVFRIFAFL